MKNVEKADRFHLGSLIDALKKGQFAIPDFQRDFEWEPWDVLDLIKSIFMDYYIGTLLLWKGSEENFKMLSCESIYSFKGKEDRQHIVLDGQQRLTAIYYAFFQPDAKFPRRALPFAYFLDIQKFLGEDYDEAFWYTPLYKSRQELLDNQQLQYEKHIFPLGIMQGGSWDISDWIKAYKDYWEDRSNAITGDDEASIHEKKEYASFANSAKEFKGNIEEMLNQYFVSYIELDRDIEIAKVCDIFTQINSKGVRLDIFDLLNALLRPKEIKLKELWGNAKEKLNYTDPKKMKIYVLQVMSILEQAYCSPKYLYYLVPEAQKIIKKPDGDKEKIILVDDEQEFKDKWDRALDALYKAIKVLKSPRDYGAIKPAFVPYPSILPPFAAIRDYVERLNANNKLDIQRKIRTWYWASVFTNRYSSSVESTSAKDFQALKRWFDNDDNEPEAIREFLHSYREINLETDNNKGSAIYNAIFNLFVIKGARDWATFDFPEYEELDDHHIIPTSVFRDKVEKKINSILNRTPLSQNTNRNIIKNRMPNQYLKEMFDNNSEEEVYKVLESHLISKKAVSILLKSPFTADDYDAFIKERHKTILEAIENELIKEKPNIPVSLDQLNKQIEAIELKLRELINNRVNGEQQHYKSLIPSHIQEKLEKRIQSEIKKKPYLSEKDFKTLADFLPYFDLFELYNFMTNKKIWPKFEDTFKIKEALHQRFIQISSLRNSIRHSREASTTEKLDGEAAIEWFNQILN